MQGREESEVSLWRILHATATAHRYDDPLLKPLFLPHPFVAFSRNSSPYCRFNSTLPPSLLRPLPAPASPAFSELNCCCSAPVCA
ncbi:hypothetical protein CRG98_008107 [Punica granatum]|uniref:Uncharacterized protein n=1 Tax=Punica granatum TaxID=22663 RepID=A0A2I0KTD3_PUNGR|nr:hypothetical protein CRG98_008107 [Punica granatum]